MRVINYLSFEGNTQCLLIVMQFVHPKINLVFWHPLLSISLGVKIKIIRIHAQDTRGQRDKPNA